LSGEALCVHAALSSFGHVDGGAAAVVEGILAAQCTLLVPTFSGAFGVLPPVSDQLKRNGTDYAWNQNSGSGDTHRFDVTLTAYDRESMGAIPGAVLAHRSHRRGNHPLNSLSAVGPLSLELTDAQRWDSVYGPLERLCDHAGEVVLMGVDLDSLTLIHLAESLAGRNLFVRWARDGDGVTRRAQVGSCSDGFGKLRPCVQSLERTRRVGESLWRVFEANALVERVIEAIERDPRVTHCGRESCQRCRDMMLGGPIL
jgi:aminoglycoside 3-N-acetyltransferase